MSNEEMPIFVRVMDLIVGLILIALGFWITFNTSLAQTTIIWGMAIGLIFLGFVRIAKSLILKELGSPAKIVKILVGIAIIVIGVSVLLFQALAISILILLITSAIMLAGASRVVVGFTETDLIKWARALYIIVGLFATFFGLFAAIIPELGFITLVLMIAVALIALGILRIIAGISGEIR